MLSVLIVIIVPLSITTKVCHYIAVTFAEMLGTLILSVAMLSVVTSLSWNVVEPFSMNLILAFQFEPKCGLSVRAHVWPLRMSLSVTFKYEPRRGLSV